MIKGPHTETTTRARTTVKTLWKTPLDETDLANSSYCYRAIPALFRPSVLQVHLMDGRHYKHVWLCFCSPECNVRLTKQEELPDFRRRIKILNDKLYFLSLNCIICISQGCQTNGQAVGYGGLVSWNLFPWATTKLTLIGRAHTSPWCNTQTLFHSRPAYSWVSLFVNVRPWHSVKDVNHLQWSPTDCSTKDYGLTQCPMQP